jgi:hypothetical protein
MEKTNRTSPTFELKTYTIKTTTDNAKDHRSHRHRHRPSRPTIATLRPI